MPVSARFEISKRLVLVNSISSVGARVINLSVLVWLHQYLLRRISPAEYSLLPVLVSVILLLPLFTTVLTAGLGRFIVAAYAKGDDRRITEIVSTMFPLLLGAGLILLAVGLVFSWYVDEVLTIPADRIWDARIMMALLVFMAATRPPCSAFTVGLFVRQKFVLHNVLRVGDEMLKLALLAVLLVGIGPRVLWVVVANVTAELLMTVVLVIVSRRLIPALRFHVRAIRWEHARELTSFGGWNFLSFVAWRLRQTIIPLILNKMAVPLDIAVFHLGSMPRRQIDVWVDTVATPLYPVVTGMHAMGAQARIRSIYLRGGRLALWVVLAMALPVTIYAQELIHLYIGNEFKDAAIVMILSLACIPVSNGTWMVWQVANATGQVRPTGICTLATQSVSIAAIFYAVGHLGWGAVGAAFASFAVGALTGSLVLWPLGLKLADVKFDTWIRRTMIPGLAPGCIAALVWAALNVLVRPDSWVELGLCAGAGLVCYAIILLVFCLEPQDRQDLATVLARVRGLVEDWVPYGRGRATPTLPAGLPSSSCPLGSAKTDMLADGVSGEIARPDPPASHETGA